MSKLPQINMEIDQTIGLDETDYLKRPELPKAVEKVKKKRVVSQKQLDSLKRAREASMAKRKLIREQKLRDKEAQKEAKLISKTKPKEKEPEVMETIEEDTSRASTPEELIDMNSAFNYDRVITSVFDLIQADKEKRRPEKEDKWNKRFKDAEDIRIDERNKLLELVKQMEQVDTIKAKPKPKEPKKRVHSANKILQNNDINWDNCFTPRRGGDNFF